MLEKIVNLLPWSIRGHIRKMPFVAPLQRWVVSQFLNGKSFSHRINAGPAAGLLYPVQMPRDKLIWTGTYEIDFATLLSKKVKKGDVCYDIGGYRGFFSGVMALAGAKEVHVYEPLPENIAQIKKVIEMNPNLKITLHELALADKTGWAAFKVMQERSMAKLSESPFQVEAEATDQIKVKTFSMDEFIEREQIAPPNLVKIDVEGAELLVLKGAARALEKSRPILLIEIHSPTLANDCRNFLESAGYQVSLVNRGVSGKGSTAEICHFLCLPTK